MGETDDGICGLKHFLDAQDTVFDQVLRELQAGNKRSHWMWYIFPQAAGLGQSDMSTYYALKSFNHVKDYARHPVLWPRLIKCTETVISHKGRSATAIFGSIDALKFSSCMTLFSVVCSQSTQFRSALDMFYDGDSDEATLRILEIWRS